MTVAPGAGQTQTISAGFVDQTGAAGSGGSWSFVKNGAGTTALTGRNAYTGGTTVNAGVLQGTSEGLQGNITNNAAVVFEQASTGTYAGILSGTGTLDKTGAGTVSLTAANTYSGATTISAGALNIRSNTALGTAAGGTTVASGAALEMQNNILVSGEALILNGSGVSNGGALRNVSGDNTYGGAITLGSASRINSDAGTLTLAGNIGGAGQNLTVGGGANTLISGVIGTTSGSLTKDGNGTLTLTAANTYSGGTTVAGGLLRFTTDASLGTAGTGITLNNGSIGTTDATPAAYSISRSITLAGNGGIDVALHPFILSGTISGTGQLIKRGAGELELTGTSTYAGGTVLEAGGLRVNSDDKLGAAGTGISFAGGALRASETFTTARNVAIFSQRNGTFQVDESKTLTLTGIVSGEGFLTKVGGGTLALPGCQHQYRQHLSQWRHDTGQHHEPAQQHHLRWQCRAIRSPGRSPSISHRRHFRRQHHGHRQRHQDGRGDADSRRHQHLQHRHDGLGRRAAGHDAMACRAPS